MHAPSLRIAGPAPSRQQVAGVYRTKVGEAEVTALLDGYIDVTPELWVNVSPDELDIDKETGVRSRRRAIDLAAADGLLIAGSHVPFPSFGHVAKSGGRFEYVPATWRFDL